MNFLEDFMEDTEANNRNIQGALREIDENALLWMMYGLDATVSEVINRNLSKCVGEALVEDLKAAEGTISEGRIQHARQDFRRKLLKYRKYSGNAASSANSDKTAGIAEITLETPENIVVFFSNLGYLLKQEGCSALDQLMPLCPDGIARKGMEYLVDGLDPLLMRSLLERLKETQVRRTELLCSMIIEGFDSLAMRDMPGITAEKLHAYFEAPGAEIGR